MIDTFIILCAIIITFCFKWYILSSILLVTIIIYVIRCSRRALYKLKHSYKPMSLIDDFDYYIDINDSYKQLVSMIQTANTRILFSCFACNFTTPIYDGHTMQDLLNDAADRGIYIYILYNTTSEYTNHSVSTLQTLLDDRIHISTITASSQITKSLQNILKQKSYSYNHQKFLICDSTIMIGGCDIDPWERRGYHIINKNKFYWHEISVSFPVPDSFIDWFTTFIQSKNNPVSKLPKPSEPFINTESEAKTIMYMIKNSQSILYVEHQLLALSKFSTDYSHAIIKCIATRLTKACRLYQDFNIHIITNVSQDDEYNVFTQFFSSNTLVISICNILSYVPSKYKKLAMNKLHIYRLENDKSNIKVHSNIFITDDIHNQYHLVRSSSNLSDRSFGTDPCDIELGVYIRHPKVFELYRQLIQLHTNGQTELSANGYVKEVSYNCTADMLRSTAFFITQLHPATGNCTHKMKIKNIR